MGSKRWGWNLRLVKLAGFGGRGFGCPIFDPQPFVRATLWGGILLGRSASTQSEALVLAMQNSEPHEAYSLCRNVVHARSHLPTSPPFVSLGRAAEEKQRPWELGPGPSGCFGSSGCEHVFP